MDKIRAPDQKRIIIKINDIFVLFFVVVFFFIRHGSLEFTLSYKSHVIASAK